MEVGREKRRHNPKWRNNRGHLLHLTRLTLYEYITKIEELWKLIFFIMRTVVLFYYYSKEYDFLLNPVQVNDQCWR